MNVNHLTIGASNTEGIKITFTLFGHNCNGFGRLGIDLVKPTRLRLHNHLASAVIEDELITNDAANCAANGHPLKVRQVANRCCRLGKALSCWRKSDLRNTDKERKTKAP
ncbi:MAG: hypothetical protein KatS3mg067_0318 [Thermosynechococcus sp.]|nr:MAG: hypothetical protein KatS3mg067_0318 [Thermosynechococcus sp.]